MKLINMGVKVNQVSEMVKDSSSGKKQKKSQKEIEMKITEVDKAMQRLKEVQQTIEI